LGGVIVCRNITRVEEEEFFRAGQSRVLEMIAARAALGRMFAVKHGYRFDANQELLGIAGANVMTGLGHDALCHKAKCPPFDSMTRIPLSLRCFSSQSLSVITEALGSAYRVLARVSTRTRTFFPASTFARGVAEPTFVSAGRRNQVAAATAPQIRINAKSNQPDKPRRF
jgi:hypothetical protein